MLARRCFPAAIVAAVLLVAAPVHAQDPAAKPACAPSVSLALNTWDAGILAAEKFGAKAADVARQKGREVLLPLLGIDPKTVQGQPGTDEATGDIGREVEASRTDPARREALCAAVTEAMNAARDKAEAGLEALKGTMERFRPTAPRQEPGTGSKDSLIKT
ncbi:MAG TPA: hypothetical protein VD978_07100 [Azospirillum sp.]|nr:hypothetical protein [Azospirillum sp.]